MRRFRPRFPARRPGSARAPLQIALAGLLLLTSVGTPLHLQTQPNGEPVAPGWAGVGSALAVPPLRVAYANDAAGAAGGAGAPAGGSGAGAAADQPAVAPAPASAPRAELADTRIGDARWRLYNGDLRGALAAFRTLSESAAGPDERAEALYWVGYTQVQLDERTRALDTIAALRRAYPNTDGANWATFLAAVLYRRRGEIDSALAHYRAFNASPAAAPFVEWEIANALLDAGRTREAYAAADAILAGSPGRILMIDALETQAKVLSAQGNDAGAAARYRTILENARTPSYRAEVGYRLGTAERAAGNAAAAVDAFAAVVRTYPATTWARRSLDALDELAPRGVNSYERGLVRYRASRYAEAGRLFARFAEEQADHPDLPNALYYLAACEEYTRDPDEALRHYDAVVDRYPAATRAPEALWQASRLREQLGRTDAATRSYSRLATSYPASERAGGAQFRLGLLRHFARDHAAAIDAWSALATSASDRKAQVAALYWRSFAQRATGDATSARNSLRYAAQAAVPTFYGARARVADAGQELTGRWASTNISRPTPSPEARAETFAWLRDRSPATVMASGAPLSLDGEPEWQLAIEFARMGLTGRAGEQISELLDRYRSDGPALFALAEVLRDEGQFRLSMRSAELALVAAGNESAWAAPRALRELIYPAYFLPMVADGAQQFGIDPLLLMALIRQESQFDMRALSSADARGLTQVMPSTGEEIARALGVSPFSADDLYEPALAVRFGAYYLRSQLERAGWNPYYALAAYNAGGGNADRWSRQAGSDPDLFYEAIDFEETRAYLDRIVANWIAYQELYR